MTAGPSPDLTAAVQDIVVAKFAAPASVTGRTPFDDMDFDSLVLVELAVHLTTTFRVPVSHEEVVEAGTIEATAGLLAAKGVTA